MSAPVFLMSYPRRDWGIRGGANFLSSTLGERPPNPRGAMMDWLSVADAIEAAGGCVMVLPPAPHMNLTGLPYTAEAGEFFLDEAGLPSFLLSRMKSPHRQPEPTWTGGFVAALGWGVRGVSATWEAQGDAIRIGEGRIVHTYGEGPMRRTEAAAYDEVAPLLSPHHLHLRYRAFPWFHGNTFLATFTAAGSEEAIVAVCPEALEPGELLRLEEFCGQTPTVEISREMSLGYATNALQVNDTVIANAGLDASIHSLWTDLGLSIVELHLPELYKRGGGSAVCLSNRLHGLTSDWVPEHLRFTALRESLGVLAESYPTEQLTEGW